MGDLSKIFVQLSFCTAILLNSAMPAGAEGLTEKTLTLGYSSPWFVQRGDAVVSQLDIDAFLSSRVPEAQRSHVLQSAERIGEILESLLLNEDYFLLAKEAGLLEQPIIQARLYRAALLELRTIYQEYFRDQTELQSYDTQARELFLTEPERFQNPPTNSFDHMLIPDHSNRPESVEMQAVLQIKAALDNGATVEEASSLVLDDAGIEASVDFFDQVQASDIVTQVAETLGQLEVDEWSEPVRSRFGWHVVRLRERHKGSQMTWEEAESRAQEIARQRHLSNASERFLRKVNATPANFAEGAVADLRSRYESSPTTRVPLSPNRQETD